MEDRRLLTTYNVSAKFTANGSGAGGEAAFGDDATNAHYTSAPSNPSGYYNNNYGTGTVTATDTATSVSPWSFGALDSGPASFDNRTTYSLSAYVDPNSFDNYLTGATSSPWSPGHPGGGADGIATGFAGIAGFDGGESGESDVIYNYGTNGLNGDGSGNPVPDFLDHYVNIPTGTLVMSPYYGPAAAKFTAPTSGSYTFTITLTNPYFDPFHGQGGHNGNDAWSWDLGQADYLIYEVPAGSTTASNTSSLIADGFYRDIASVNQADVPAVGNSINSSSGLTINSGAGGQGPGGQYGSGGTWSLTNVGAMANPPSQDTTGDEYDMKWTVTQTVSLGVGDSVEIVTNPEFNGASSYHTDNGGDYTAPIYLSASASNAIAAPIVATSGSTGLTFTVGGTAKVVDSGVTVTSGDPDLTGATETITNYQSGDLLHFNNQNGISGSYSAGVLTLSGSATPAQYQTALQSVTFSTTSTFKGTRTVDVVALDSNDTGNTPSNTGVDTVIVAIAAPVVTASGSTGQTFTLGGTAKVVDSGVTVTSYDTDLTGATETISNYQSGDLLHFTNQNGISGSYSGGVLTLSGSATPAQYQTALQSVTFSTTSTVKGTRTVDVVALDSNDTGNVSSNTGVDTVVAAIAPPVVMTSSDVSFNGANGASPGGSFTLGGSTLYGTTGSGGAYHGTAFQGAAGGFGTVFSIPASGGAPTVLASFDGTDGQGPSGDLTLNGSTLYGMTIEGGANNEGTIFSIPATGGTPTVLASFNGTNGSDPHGSLTLSGSTLYGMTSSGGVNGEGTIFAIPVTGGTPTTLLSFNGTDGGGPNGSLTLSGSTFYGMTGYGGANGDGTIFSIPVTGGTPTTLLSFNGTDGRYPSGSLTLSGSTLYGMTNGGGTNGEGTVFSIPVTGGSATTLLSFNGTNGEQPTGDLTLNGSTLYGTTSYGGANNDGIIFSIPVTGGSPTTLLSFNGANGSNPGGSLTLIGSTLYGMAGEGGASGDGTAFSMNTLGVGPAGTTDQTFTLGGSAVTVDSGVTVTSGDTDITGASMTITNDQSGDSFNYTPIYGIAIASNTSGVLSLTGSATPTQYTAALQSVTFSTTSTVKGTRTIDVVADDSNDTGNLPSNTGVDSVVVAIAAPIMTTSDFQTLLSFNGTNGQGPSGNLTLNGSTLYGMTSGGGANSDGTIFSIPAAGGAPTTLLSFDGTDGESPEGSLTLGGSTLYGMTIFGGADDEGTVFSIPVTGGAPTILFSFDGTNGEDPSGSLTLSGSTLYGMTRQGGANNEGTIFSIPVTGGSPTILFSFDGTNGEGPSGSLTLSGSTLYGMTTDGGANGDGNVFSIPVTGGAPTTLASFNGTNGAYPSGSLTLTGSTLYGMTPLGGAYDFGTVFSVPLTGGAPNVLTSFNGTTGQAPSGDLTLNGSTLYGMTSEGGSYGNGNVFSIPVTGGTPTTLLSFNGTNGEGPGGSLTLSGSTLYGMAEEGGLYNGGTVFSMNVSNTFTLGGAAIAIDSGVTVSSFDTDITGASITVANYQSGDSLNYTPINGITIAGNSTGVLNLTGSATPAQYTAALQSVTFSTNSTNTTPRTVDVVADDANDTGNLPSNTGVDSVIVVIDAPVVTTSAFQTLYSFSGTSGDTPEGGLTLSGSTLYGTTAYGGVNGDGNIFSMPVTGGAPTNLTSFTGPNGEAPFGSLTLIGSRLYGTTSRSTQGNGSGAGTIFTMPVTGGSLANIGGFNGADGLTPYGSLTLSADGSTFYGMSSDGGANGEGTIFSIPVTGATPSTLLSFDGTDGAYPTGDLTLSADGSTLYGTTQYGGANNEGTVFSIPVTGGTPTVLLSFDGANGANPAYGELTLSGSTLYGMTGNGGADNDGTVFSIPVTGGTATTLLSFNGTNGSLPQGSLTLIGPTLYGTTYFGGANGDGTIFSIPVTGGTPITLLSFNGANGSGPQGSLMLSGSTLYGMTAGGGANGHGTVFSINALSVGSSGTGNTFTVGGSAVVVDPNVTASSSDTDLTGASMTITNYQSGDALNFNNQNGITGSYSAGVLNLTGSATPAQYTAALQSVTFSTTSTYTTTRTVDIVALDTNDTGNVPGNTLVDTVAVAVIAAPVVTTSGSTGQTFAIGGAAVAVDSGVTVTSSDTDITGASMTITNYQSGDSLNFTNASGIIGSYNSGTGVLALTGGATPAQYQAALQSVTFSTTSLNATSRTVDVVALDGNGAGSATSNTGVDSVFVAIAPPVVTTSDFQTLFSFNGTDGNGPLGTLTLSGSTLYGTTQGGGVYGDGTVFSVPVTGGTPTTLFSFNGANGGLPQGSLILSGSTLYGMTVSDGVYGDGTIFSIPVTGGTPTDPALVQWHRRRKSLWRFDAQC